MSRMTKIKKISTAWFVVLSFVLQLVYPLTPVEVQAAEIRPEDRIELGNPNNPVMEPKGWASKPNRRADNIYKQAKAMGYGDLRYIEKDLTKIYEFYHPWNTERAKELGTNEYDHDTVNTRDTNNSWTGLGSGYVRRTEIVPMGDVPKSKITKRYVMDDGTFVPPTEAAKTIFMEKRPYTSELPRPTFIFKEPNYNDPSRIDLNSVTAQYLPKKGQGEAAVYHEENQYLSPYLYYCINVNSYDASRIGGGYFLQPGKYSAQSNFRDLPEIPFILMEIGKELGIKNMSALDQPAARASMARASDLWYAEYEHIYKATGAELNQPSKYIPELTNGEIQAMLYRVLTLHGKEEVINGKTFRVQTDRDTSHPDALKSLIPKEGVSEDDKSSSFVMGIEYPFNYYVMGMPIDAVDILETPGVPLFNRTYANKYLSRALIRLFVAYTEAAREKGLLDKHLMRSDLEAEIVRKQKKEGNTELTIRLTNVKGAKKIEAIIPNELTLVEPANCQSRQGTHTEANKTIYTLPVEANVNNTYDIKVSFDKNQITDGNKQLDFAVYKRQNVIGRVWAPKGCYKFDKESGHWLVLEYVHFESWETGTEGFVHGQQVVSFTEQEEDVRTSVRFDVTTEPIPALATTVETNNGQGDIKQASSEQPIVIEGTKQQTVKVTDTIAYRNLQPNGVYTVETSLQKVNDDGTTTLVGNVHTSEQKTVEGFEGTWKIELGEYQLEPNTKYVVFEKATLKTVDGQVPDDPELLEPVKHENPEDKAQTVVMVAPKGTLRTTVTANNISGAEDKVAGIEHNPDGVEVKDTIQYTNLVPKETYSVTGTLMKIGVDGSETQIATKTEELVADTTGSGSWEINFGKVSKLEVGAKYVVYEEATSKNPFYQVDDKTNEVVKKPAVIEHKDPNDRAQTVVVKSDGGVIRTTVTSGQNSATSDKPLGLTTPEVEKGVPVKDTISYENMIPNAKYNLTGTLMHIKKDDSVEAAKKKDGSILSVTKEVTADATGKGSWEIDFGTVDSLEIGEKYVVYEKAVSKDNYWQIDKNGNAIQEKVTVSHEDKNDTAQTLVAGRADGKLRTTVNANGNLGEATSSALVPFVDAKDGVTVKDTVAYENLVPNATYTLEGTLMWIKSDGSEEAIASKTEQVTANDTGNSRAGEEWVIDFSKVEGLKIGEKYVVYEVATSNENVLDSKFDGNIDMKQIVEHKNKDDRAQTFVIGCGDGQLRTTASANSVTSSAIQAASIVVTEEQEVIVTDTIDYVDLAPNEVYTVEGTLMNIKQDGSAVAVPNGTMSKEFTTSSTGSGQWTLTFNAIKGLKVGEKYVVYEVATSNKNLIDKDRDGVVETKDIIRHEDSNDAAQTFVVSLPKGEIRTTVTSGNLVGEQDKELKLSDAQVEAGVPVKDIVYYENLVPNETYKLTGTLMHIMKDKSVVPVVSKDGKTLTVTKEVIADATGNGQWEIDFGMVNCLVVGEKYVVYERAVSKNTYWSIDETGKTVNSNITIVHEDPRDKAQTIVAGRQKGILRTTVTADGHEGQTNANASVSIEEVKDGVTVKDTVAYEDLVPNAEYILEGTLMHIQADGTATAIAGPVQKEVKANSTGESAPGEEWVIEFGNVKGLKVGEKYVVYEVATSKENVFDSKFDGNIDMKQVVEHKDPNDKAQTFVLELKEDDGTLRTTVSANGDKASAEQEVSVSIGDAKKGVHVIDTIYYSNLAPNETYEVEATLMHVPSIGEIKPVTGSAVITNQFTTDENGFGEWTVDFGTVEGLVTGEKYVVYEVATSNNLLIDTDKDGVLDKKHTVRHEDPTDKAQAAVVEGPKKISEGTLRTTVTADDKVGSDTKEATLEVNSDLVSVHVKDTVVYTNLVPNEEYHLEATLVHVSKNGIVPVTGTSITVKTDKSGNGQWEIDFGLVEGLKAGEKYVIYEVATSEQELIDTDNDGKADQKDVIEHKNPSDKAQTIVIEQPVIPETPEKPEPKPEDNYLGGSIRTTIVADGKEGSSSSPAIITDQATIDAGISIKDIVYYEDLVAGETYILEGTLMHIVDGKAEPVEGAYKRQHVVASSTGNGQWEVNFGVVKGLKMGETYVVYEKATSVNLLEDTDNDKKPDASHILVHENPNDKAQTLLLETPVPEKPEKPENEKPTTPSTSNSKKRGSLRTTVVAAGQTGASDKAVWVPSRYEKTDAQIKDIVYYTNLIPNAKYELEATLMHVRSDGTVTPVRGATVKQIVVADRSGNGVWNVDFGVVKDLVKEEKYVVYEKATSVDFVLDTDRDDLFDSKHIVIHQNPNDNAQTIFVKSEKAVGFYLKGQILPMGDDMTLLGNPEDDKKNDTHLSLFGKQQPGFGYAEDKNMNMNYPLNSKKHLPQTGSIISTTTLCMIGAMIASIGGVLLLPRRRENK